MHEPETVTIEDVTDVLIDYRGKTPQKASNGIKLLTAKLIKDGRIADGPYEYISASEYDSWMKRGLPEQGDILITTEAPLGEVAQLRTAEKVALAQRVILLRGKPSAIDQGYYFYALRSPFVQDQLMARATGTTVLGIRQSELRKVSLPYYSLETQRKIASILAAYDDLIENNLRRIGIVEEMARAIYREWFVEFRYPGYEDSVLVESECGPIPDGWEAMRLTEAIQVNPAAKVEKKLAKPYADMACLSTGSMIVQFKETRTGASGSKFQNGDTLVARITPCLENGKTGFVQGLHENEVALGSTEFIVFRSVVVCPEYVYLMARTDSFRQHAIKSMTGASGRQRVQTTCFNDYLLAIPPRGLLDQFSMIAAPMFRQAWTLSEINDKLRQTRDILLPRLISGELDVSDIAISSEGDNL